MKSKSTNLSTFYVISTTGAELVFIQVTNESFCQNKYYTDLDSVIENLICRISKKVWSWLILLTILFCLILE